MLSINTRECLSILEQTDWHLLQGLANEVKGETMNKGQQLREEVNPNALQDLKKRLNTGLN